MPEPFLFTDGNSFLAGVYCSRSCLFQVFLFWQIGEDHGDCGVIACFFDLRFVIKVKGYLERTRFGQDLTLHYGEDEALRLCHEQMFEAGQLPRNRDLRMNSIMYEYLFLLAEKFPNEGIAYDEKKSDYAEEALNFIESNYCDPITIQDIADHLNINRSYLHRVFKAFTGISIQNYLLDYRIRQACILLRSTELSVRAIAHAVSYADPLYFSRLFHQKKGISPSSYRKAASPPVRP